MKDKEHNEPRPPVSGLRKLKTGRKQAAEVLTGKALDAILISISDPMSIMDKDLNIIWANNTAKKIFGDDIIGKKCYQAYHGRKKPCEPYPCITLKAFRDGKVHEHDTQVVSKAGEIIYFHSTANVTLRDTGGEPIAVLEISRDITEQKQAEEELRESEERFRKIFNSTQDCIFIETPEGYIVDVNQAACSLLGYTRDELLKMRVGDVVPPEIAAQLPPIIQEETVKGGRYIETEELCKDGSRVPVEVSNTMAEIGGQKIVIAVVRDITERKRVEEELRRGEERSRYAQRMEAIGRLSGGISHDFGNLLTAIMGFSELALQQLDAGSPIRQDVNEVIKVSRKAGKLIRQLMAFSRKQALQVQIINLNTLVKDMGKMLHQLVRENIEVEINLTPDRVRVKADPGQMEQVIVNLVVNACDAIPAEGEITIKTENVDLDGMACETINESRCGRFACLIIHDTGTGMTEEVIEHIFEPFFTTKATGEGSGLGMSTVYGIVKQHQGWINVYSEPGRGSVFKVYLPAIDLEPEEDMLDGISTEELQGRRERVLVIEDDESVRSVIVRLLRDNGYVVREAENAARALEIFEIEKGELDVIFSDVILPDQDGIGLIDQLLGRKPELKILLGSGYIDLKTFGSIIREREYPLLTKPYTAIALLRALREIIEK
ncbi:MAG: PAS domain S-box protein [Candidatus Auribacterota bacterium]|nr:PAS domain S-box protein [Candidatus Auribacterota bacterium]